MNHFLFQHQFSLKHTLKATKALFFEIGTKIVKIGHIIWDKIINSASILSRGNYVPLY